jgi:orotidine-5'-phosphate decarboxylase
VYSLKTEERIIVALDFPAKDEVFQLLDRVPGLAYVKVGMELFYSEGPNLVSMLKDRGLKVFVDLKIHDIPSTAYKTIKVLGRLGCDMVDVHCAGGLEMMLKARDALIGDTKLIGVTQLTSIDQQLMNNQLWIRGSLEDCVLHYAALAKEARLHGVVCSPREAAMIKKHLGKGFLAVTPGVRPPGSTAGDQRRMMTPGEAIKAGSDYLVIGRPITASPDPKLAFAQILAEIEVVA